MERNVLSVCARHKRAIAEDTEVSIWEKALAAVEKLSLISCDTDMGGLGIEPQQW